MDVKVKRNCTECGVVYSAASGHVCKDCWPEYQTRYPEWLEWVKVRGPGWEWHDKVLLAQAKTLIRRR